MIREAQKEDVKSIAYPIRIRYRAFKLSIQEMILNLSNNDNPSPLSFN